MKLSEIEKNIERKIDNIVLSKEKNNEDGKKTSDSDLSNEKPKKGNGKISKFIFNIERGNNSDTVFKKIFIILFVFAFFLALTLQLNTISSVQGNRAESAVNGELRNTLLMQKSKNEKLMEMLEEKEEKLNEIREETAKNNIRFEEKKNLLNENNKKLGYTELTGKGIVLTLSDGISKKNSNIQDSTQLVVHDSDILAAINILRNAGADAISVNDQRVIAKTPITCVGTVIKINEEKVGAPYVISAIGNQEYLESALKMPGGILELLEQYGISTKLEKGDNIKIPAYVSTDKMEYAEVDK